MGGVVPLFNILVLPFDFPVIPSTTVLLRSHKSPSMPVYCFGHRLLLKMSHIIFSITLAAQFIL